MRILVIEDDPNLKDQIKQSLEDSGYSVDSANDGEEGHFLGDTEPYDAVVLDLGLPKVDGISVLEKWRKDKKNFPVLILTAREFILFLIYRQSITVASFSFNKIHS